MGPTLISPTELADRLSDDILVVQVTTRQVYDAAHVPGAVCVEPRQLVSGGAARDRAAAGNWND